MGFFAKPPMRSGICAVSITPSSTAERCNWRTCGPSRWMGTRYSPSSVLSTVGLPRSGSSEPPRCSSPSKSVIQMASPILRPLGRFHSGCSGICLLLPEHDLAGGTRGAHIYDSLIPTPCPWTSAARECQDVRTVDQDVDVVEDVLNIGATPVECFVGETRVDQDVNVRLTCAQL